MVHPSVVRFNGRKRERKREREKINFRGSHETVLSHLHTAPVLALAFIPSVVNQNMISKFERVNCEVLLGFAFGVSCLVLASLLVSRENWNIHPIKFFNIFYPIIPIARLSNYFFTSDTLVKTTLYFRHGPAYLSPCRRISSDVCNRNRGVQRWRCVPFFPDGVVVSACDCKSNATTTTRCTFRKRKEGRGGEEEDGGGGRRWRRKGLREEVDKGGEENERERWTVYEKKGHRTNGGNMEGNGQMC
jgi:hypothetical protein